MAIIELTDNSALEISSKNITPTLRDYLQTGVLFLFGKLSSDFKQTQNKHIGELDAGTFPLTLIRHHPGKFHHFRFDAEGTANQ